MKRVFSFLLLLAVLFLGVEFIITSLTKEYAVNYDIYAIKLYPNFVEPTSGDSFNN